MYKNYIEMREGIGQTGPQLDKINMYPHQSLCNTWYSNTLGQKCASSPLLIV